jgi:hypothetical protein
MIEIKIIGFSNRGTEECPFGYIDFTDGLRIGYAPDAEGVDEYGLFNPNQPYAVQPRELSPQHIKAAQEWVHLTVLV